ncbi:hypothetical protein CAPTEDRAFT_194096 [Capitella teleta]|uniref:Uncharacterized protein n=1 Tax=Capitella teleta TaxID=283909 RepID=R7U4M6_CAPTE|nr:hypothetical protein CAPTEDRAFT_194096 [Capitella teleta]|eukprot:ELU00904.1 hypothetical protein CAPTEDRAFT_194096 [Capitella teleta]
MTILAKFGTCEIKEKDLKEQSWQYSTDIYHGLLTSAYLPRTPDLQHLTQTTSAEGCSEQERRPVPRQTPNDKCHAQHTEIAYRFPWMLRWSKAVLDCMAKQSKQRHFHLKERARAVRLQERWL